MFAHTRLIQCREQKKIDKTELVYQLKRYGLNVSRNTIISWEKGDTQPSIENLTMLCKFYNKPITFFFK